MSGGVNKVILLGNLGQDPELKALPGGQSVLNMRIATTEVYFDKNNTKQERTDWHSVAVWGKRADGLAKFLRKGAQVYVEGRIQTRSYEKNGEKRYATDIQAHDVIVTGGRAPGDRAADGGSDGGTRAPSGGGSAPADDFASDIGGDDEIPF